MDPTTRDWYRFDTLSALYTVLKDKTYCFGSKELDAYDHIFCGTHPHFIDGRMNANDREGFINTHNDAKHDYKKLQGIWKLQDEYFLRRSVKS